jgi:hypothetical protein
MKRLLLIFLLTALPLQMSWAAVSMYCQHESGAAAKHFGHHEHKHQAKADDQQKNKSPLTNDADCGFCQFSIFGIASMSPDIIAMSLLQAGSSFSRIEFLSYFLPERPERPKWASAV